MAGTVCSTAAAAAAAAAVEQTVPAIRQQQAEHAAELGGALFPVAEQRQHTGRADGVPGVAAVNAGEAAQCVDEKSRVIDEQRFAGMVLRQPLQTELDHRLERRCLHLRIPQRALSDCVP